jgi:Fe(3+) dicitrate transport protein
VYANFSQNYSPVNFGDIIVEQPGFKVDPNLKDVKGYNFDIGYRGRYKTILSFDVSAFYMLYKNRIGTLLQIDSVGNVYQYETNISDSRSTGAETYLELNILHLVPAHRYSANKVSLYSSVAYTNAMYIHTNTLQTRQFEGKLVEYAAPWICRFGLDYAYKNLSGSLQYSYTASEFSDATNAPYSTDGTLGIIPSYYTIDFTTGYKIRNFRLSFSINNLTNQMYFTRRTTGFPGPGIIPSAGRTFYFTFEMKL